MPEIQTKKIDTGTPPDPTTIINTEPTYVKGPHLEGPAAKRRFREGAHQVA